MAEDEMPNPNRVGLVRFEAGQPIVHYCQVCGAWGAWGYDVNLSTGRLGRWYCGAHRPDQKGNASGEKRGEAASGR